MEHEADCMFSKNMFFNLLLYCRITKQNVRYCDKKDFSNLLVKIATCKINRGITWLINSIIRLFLRAHHIFPFNDFYSFILKFILKHTYCCFLFFFT